MLNAMVKKTQSTFQTRKHNHFEWTEHWQKKRSQKLSESFRLENIVDLDFFLYTSFNV